MIYAIQCGDSGPIKIGRAGNVKHRLKELQTSHYERLRLLTSMWAMDDVKQERAYHERLAAHRIRGEWFRPEPAVLAVVVEIGKGAQTLQQHAKEAVEEYRSLCRKRNLVRIILALRSLIHRAAKPVY